VQWTDEFARQSGVDEMRIVDTETMLGSWICPLSAPWLSSPGLRAALNGYFEPRPDTLVLHYVLKRV
jgi:hypothetical protein